MWRIVNRCTGNNGKKLFLDALADRETRARVLKVRPGSLEEAVTAATKFDVKKSAERKPGPRRVRLLERETEQDMMSDNGIESLSNDRVTKLYRKMCTRHERAAPSNVSTKRPVYY